MDRRPARLWRKHQTPRTDFFAALLFTRECFQEREFAEISADFYCRRTDAALSLLPQTIRRLEGGRVARTRSFSVEAKLAPDCESWLTLGKHSPPDSKDMEALCDKLEALADKLHGEYDGWELSVSDDTDVRPT
jgi:hypothetical protein